MRHVEISQLAKDRELTAGFDDARNCAIIDSDKVCDELEDTADINIAEGGKIIDYHSSDFFPERYFQLVVVLRTDNTLLWERLEGRGYTADKVQENVQAEIMQVVLEEARESYPNATVVELENNTTDQFEENIEKVVAWLQEQSS